MAAAATDPGIVGSPQLIPAANTTPTVNFPTSTFSPAASSASTGPAPQLVPTVGSTNPGSNANTSVPGAPAPAPGPDKVPSVIPGATKVPSSDQTTIAPVAPNENVSTQLDKLLASGSPYIDLAKSTALQSSAARGLQNSSIAAGAGETAAIAAALPIAQQDASTALTTQQANQTALNQASQIEQQGTETQKVQAAQIAEQTQSTLTTTAAQLAGQLQNTLAAQAQQGSINYTLQAQTEAANINQILQQGIVNSGLSKQQSDQQIQQINQTSLDTINQIDAQAKANASQDGPALQAQYLTGVTNIMNATAAQIQAIYSTTGLTPAQQQNAVAVANQTMQQNINNLAAYYASSPLWDTGQNPAPIPPGAIPTPVTPVAAPPPTTTVTRSSPVTIPGVGTITLPPGTPTPGSTTQPRGTPTPP